MANNNMFDDVDLLLCSNSRKNQSSISLEEYGACGDIGINPNGLLISQKKLFQDTPSQPYYQYPEMVYESSNKTIRNDTDCSIYGIHVNNMLKYSKNQTLLSVFYNKINYYDMTNNHIYLSKSYTFDIPIVGIGAEYIQHSNICVVCLEKCILFMSDLRLFSSISTKSRPICAHINEFIGEECVTSLVGHQIGLHNIKCNASLCSFTFDERTGSGWCEADYCGHPRVSMYASENMIGLVDFRKKMENHADLLLFDDMPGNPKVLKTHPINNNSALSIAITKSGVMGFDSRMPGVPVIYWSCHFNDLILSDLFGEDRQFLCVRDSKRSVIFDIDFSSGSFIEANKARLVSPIRGQSHIVGLALVPSQSGDLFPSLLQINAWGDIFCIGNSKPDFDTCPLKGYSCESLLPELFTSISSHEVISSADSNTINPIIDISADYDPPFTYLSKWP